jgi:hypothetical protein
MNKFMNCLGSPEVFLQEELLYLRRGGGAAKRASLRLPFWNVIERPIETLCVSMVHRTWLFDVLSDVTFDVRLKASL